MEFLSADLRRCNKKAVLYLNTPFPFLILLVGFCKRLSLRWSCLEIKEQKTSVKQTVVWASVPVSLQGQLFTDKTRGQMYPSIYKCSARTVTNFVEYKQAVLFYCCRTTAVTTSICGKYTCIYIHLLHFHMEQTITTSLCKYCIDLSSV